jgi:hypothetical protein
VKKTDEDVIRQRKSTKRKEEKKYKNNNRKLRDWQEETKIRWKWMIQGRRRNGETKLLQSTHVSLSHPYRTKYVRKPPLGRNRSLTVDFGSERIFNDHRVKKFIRCFKTLFKTLNFI